MSHAPELRGTTRGCTECDFTTTSRRAFWEHAETEHPETATTISATPEQMAWGLAEMADLRRSLGRE